jgi:hypothetical protein
VRHRKSTLLMSRPRSVRRRGGLLVGGFYHDG